MNTASHWDNVFSAKADNELGWFEADASQTLAFLEGIPQLAEATIFLPGAGTSVLVDTLLPLCAGLVLNDLSEVPLQRLRERIGSPENIHFLQHDIATLLPPEVPMVDLWVDRAVLHFLREEGQIATYFANLHSRLRPGGHVLLAEFSTEGAPKCAGLELHRYSLEEMQQRIGPGYTLLRHEAYTFTNPWGEPRPYLYALFRREASAT